MFGAAMIGKGWLSRLFRRQKQTLSAADERAVALVFEIGMYRFASGSALDRVMKLMNAGNVSEALSAAEEAYVANDRMLAASKLLVELNHPSIKADQVRADAAKVEAAQEKLAQGIAHLKGAASPEIKMLIVRGPRGQA